MFATDEIDNYNTEKYFENLNLIRLQETYNITSSHLEYLSSLLRGFPIDFERNEKVFQLIKGYVNRFLLSYIQKVVRKIFVFFILFNFNFFRWIQKSLLNSTVKLTLKNIMKKSKHY